MQQRLKLHLTFGDILQIYQRQIQLLQASRYITSDKMAMSQAANYVEKVVGHGENAVVEQNVTNPARDREKYGDPSGERMLAAAWMGKNNVQVGTSKPHS